MRKKARRRRGRRRPMTIEQTMRYACMSRSTVNRRLRDGTFTRLKRGHLTVISPEEIDRWRRLQREPRMVEEAPHAAQ